MTRGIAAVIAVLAVFPFSATASAEDEIWIEPRCSLLPFKKLGPFVHLSDGSLLCIQGNTASVADGGKTRSDPADLTMVPNRVPATCRRANAVRA